MIQFPYVVETSRGPVTFRSVGAPIAGITQGEGAYHPNADEARQYQRLYDTSTLQAHYKLTRLPWLKKVIAEILAERGVTVAEAK